MANILQMEKKISVIASLAEGASIRAINRITGIHQKTIMDLGMKVGLGCARLMDENMRRLTRLTNAFSKKLDSFKAAVALHFGYYNFVRLHKTLKATPAFAAGVARNTWTVADLIERAV